MIFVDFYGNYVIIVDQSSELAEFALLEDEKMEKSFELEELKKEMENAFQEKQEKLHEYLLAKSRTKVAWDVRQSVQKERIAAKENMLREYDKLKEHDEEMNSVWNEYRKLYEEHNLRIGDIQVSSNENHQFMVKAFEGSRAAYESGDKDKARELASIARHYKGLRDDLNRSVQRLIQEIKDAKESAQWRTSVDCSSYKTSKAIFDEVRDRYCSVKEEFYRLKTEQDEKKEAFYESRERFYYLRSLFQSKLKDLRAAETEKCKLDLAQAGVEQQDAKIVMKNGRQIQVYYGGLGKSDGFGHGHIVVESGRKVYERPALTDAK